MEQEIDTTITPQGVELRLPINDGWVDFKEIFEENCKKVRIQGKVYGYWGYAREVLARDEYNGYATKQQREELEFDSDYFEVGNKYTVRLTEHCTNNYKYDLSVHFFVLEKDKEEIIVQAYNTELRMLKGFDKYFNTKVKMIDNLIQRGA